MPHTALRTRLAAAAVALAGAALSFRPVAAPGAEWDRERDAVYVSDLAQAAPRSALSADGRPGTWKLVSYSTERTSGNMVFSAPQRAVAPELRLKVPVAGWHALYVGINYQFIWQRPQLVKVRLESDPAFTWFTREGEVKLRLTPDEARAIDTQKKYTDRDIVEVFWKAVELRSGEELVIARKGYDPLRLWHAGTDFADTVANFSYLKLVPLSEREVAEARAARGRPETRKVMAINDMGWLRWARSRAELREELEPLRDTDVSMMLWGTFRGSYTAYFKTRAGAVPTGGDNEFEKFFSTFGEGMDAFRRLGIDPLAEAVAYAHSLGIKLIASLRMDGPKPPPYDAPAGPLYAKHPEYRCRDRDGSVMPRVSLAFPEVRRTFVEMFREAVGYGADGVAVICARNYPFVGYEAPVSESFQKKHGVEATALAPDDPRWLRHQASYVTVFMRELRSMLDEEGSKRGRRLDAVAMIRGTLEHQLDVDTWLAERLVNYLVLHPWGASTVTEEQVQSFRARTHGTGVELYVDFYPRELPAELIRRNALSYYRAGAEGFCLWDTDGRIKRPGEWAAWSRLGHRADLESRRGSMPRLFRVVPLRTFAGYRVDASWWHSTG